MDVTSMIPFITPLMTAAAPHLLDAGKTQPKKLLRKSPKA